MSQEILGMNGTGQKESAEKVPTWAEYDQTIGSSLVSSVKVRELYHLNKVVFKDLILSIDHKNKTGKVAFKFIKNCKTKDYP